LYAISVLHHVSKSEQNLLQIVEEESKENKKASNYVKTSKRKHHDSKLAKLY
jgi:hypothetical protein